jgi:hypothetical protein
MPNSRLPFIGLTKSLLFEPIREEKESERKQNNNQKSNLKNVITGSGICHVMGVVGGSLFWAWSEKRHTAFDT